MFQTITTFQNFNSNFKKQFKLYNAKNTQKKYHRTKTRVNSQHKRKSIMKMTTARVHSKLLKFKIAGLRSLPN